MEWSKEGLCRMVVQWAGWEDRKMGMKGRRNEEI